MDFGQTTTSPDEIRCPKCDGDFWIRRYFRDNDPEEKPIFCRCYVCGHTWEVKRA
jgi:DNA-directed RNA polymerase subunit M/transcription elongation factor TFIIS